MFILANNKTEKLGFTNADIIELIKLNTEQLLQVDNKDRNYLLYILRYNLEQELGFNLNEMLGIKFNSPVQKTDFKYKENIILPDYSKLKEEYDKIEIVLPEEIKTELSKIIFDIKRISVIEVAPEIKIFLRDTAKIIDYMGQEINFYSKVKNIDTFTKEIKKIKSKLPNRAKSLVL